MYYGSSRMSVDGAMLEHCADQLATLCATLAEYPHIRYQSVRHFTTLALLPVIMLIH